MKQLIKVISMETKTLEKISARTQFVNLYNERNPFYLESGETLQEVDVAYQTYGELNTSGTNAILVCHALTGNAHAAGTIDEAELENSKGHEFLFKYNKMNLHNLGWWDSLIGPGKVFDTEKYFVICSNFLGGCYGTTGPTSLNKQTDKQYRMAFPKYSVRDMVKVQKKLLDVLGVKGLVTVAGGSLGGMQALEWAIMFPDFMKSVIPIATAAQHSAWAIAFNTLSRQVILNDAGWQSGNYLEQPKGLAAARIAAMISYRAPEDFNQKFGRETDEESENPLDTKFQIENYLLYQGEKLVKRFDANTYLYITNAMDSHDVAAQRRSLEESLGRISAKCLSIGISSDILYPPDEQKSIASQIKEAEYEEIDSPFGHDAFLIEFEQVSNFITKFFHKNGL
ncbi:MAG: homoserine O-acetyltransferase [Ignavibacteriaceae bacterium]|nr:homoserine O-acetyltransferase [Ignavibacteriaceae bacterium]